MNDVPPPKQFNNHSPDSALDSESERYGLSWPGKAECNRAIHGPSEHALVPCREESVNFDETENRIFEGDNLEILKLLSESHRGRVKMIYIDPPYNTGSDFIYQDDFTEPRESYLAKAGRRAAAGNGRADGRFHSRWLSMIYPRLALARNLLADDGVLFVSIDDREVAHLRLAAAEIFGEENFLANVVWQKKYTRSNDARHFSDNHDHVLVFAKESASLTLNLLPRTSRQAAAYSNPDGHPKGPWKSTPLHAKSGTAIDFQYTFRNGVKWSPPPGTFPRFSHQTLAALEADDAIWFGNDGTATPSRKTFLSEVRAGVTPTTIWAHDEVGHNHEANSELKALGLAGVFHNPKPTRLVRRMLDLATRPREQHLVLDFFAGSGTTAQAVLDANQADGGNRRFLLVQIPEPTGRTDFPTIAEITKERVRRHIQRLSEIHSGSSPDRGFRVLKLARHGGSP